MRVGEMPHSDQSIGFHNGELIVSPELMVKDVPYVEVLDGVSMTAVYVTDKGRERTAEYNGSPWRGHFRPGDTLKRVDVGTEPISYAMDEETVVARCKGRVTPRELAEGELLIMQKREFRGLEEAEMVLLAATEPLPGTRGKVDYEFLGVITTEGSLLGFSHSGKGARELVDMCLAMQLADTPTDALVLNRFWGIQSSLVHSLQMDKLATTYLQYWRGVRGEDHFPTMEPGQLWEQVGPPDQDVIERYSKTGGAVVGLADL